MRALGRVADVALWLGAAVGTLCALAVLLGAAFGIRPLIFTSGSMGPTIDTGALALAHRVPAGDLHVGDVVSVPVDGGRVTHRIVTLTLTGEGTATLHLRGDANATPDPEPYDVASADRVWLAVPHLGSVVAWLARAPGVYLLAAYAAGLVVLLLRRRPENTGPADPAGRVGRRVRRHRLRSGATLSAAAVLGVLTVAAPTWASWADDVVVTGSTLTAYTVPAPTLSCGTLSIASTNFTWTAVPGATSYTLHYQSGSSTVTTTATSHSVPNLAAANTAWVVANVDFGSTTWSSANSNTRSYYVLIVGICG